jgi:hypothetical protein
MMISYQELVRTFLSSVKLAPGYTDSCSLILPG